MRSAGDSFLIKTGGDAYLGDRELAERMRAIALSARIEGDMPLRAPRGAERTLRALREACGKTPEEGRFPALSRAADALGLFEDFAYSLRRERPGRYPACMGLARVQLLAREALSHSDGRLGAKRLTDALAAFDEARPLRMEELSVMPKAIKLECLRMYISAAEELNWLMNERAAAERWVWGDGAPRESGAFLEHAIRLLRGADEPEKRAVLEKALSRHEGGADGLVRRAHERQAILSLWMENLPGSMRMPDALRQDELLSLSETEKLLREDSVYRASDIASRALARGFVASLARAAKASETRVAALALEAARGAEPGAPRATALWFIARDEGRAELFRALGAPFPRNARVHPDPKGRAYMAAVAVGFLLLYIAFLFARPNGWAAVGGLIAAWTIAQAGVSALCSRLVPPRPLMRIENPNGEENRTLTVIPALLPTPERARELMGQLESIAAQDGDEMDFCLLGDFPDALSKRVPGDEAVLEAGREEARRANDRAGRERFFYLHREREYNEASRAWMGRERKRGALTALNDCLLRGENAFTAEGEAALLLRDRYRYVITLDADTRPYPGALNELIGAMAHPVNAGIRVIQPRMALSLRTKRSPFLRLMAGEGGVNGYADGVSDVYQDLCGQGGFAGKGIYDPRAFSRAVERRLPENAILSHDLIEGFLAGSAFADDIVLLDGFPGTLTSYLKRTHRWTRGDWQLLPFLRGRTGLQKYRMLDNLRASLAAPAALLLLLSGLCSGNGWAALLGIACLLTGALYAPFRAQTYLRALSGIALLPNEAWCRLDAIGRALYRTFVTRRNMLEWVPAAEAERQKGKTPVMPRAVAALLCVPGFFHPGMALFAGVLAALFLGGAPILESLENAPARERLTPAQKDFLRALARDTWRFFEESVPVDGMGFPPDNVQYDPPRGAARRTSPTNIGLYMVSCVSARELGFLSKEEAVTRLSRTAASLEAVEKWRGQLYNWYDPATLRPLAPRYVSSVDGGNLAACLLLCAGALTRDGADEGEKALAERLLALSGDMELSALYDPVRDLFHIGFDAEKGVLSQSHYDLLASESRLMSYAAILLKQAPVRHWRRLSRACVRVDTLVAPASWSGTAFEYLLPELFLPAPDGSLLSEGARSCVLAQRASAIEGVWGISESGYYAFDSRLNYQYRAFGVRALMRRDERTGRVISPYSSALALGVSPGAAADNLRALSEAGLRSERGLYEAVDFSRERLADGETRGVVASCMAHHQGMLLASCANALTDGAISDCFERLPGVRALYPLLEETPPERARLPRELPAKPAEAQRSARPVSRLLSREGRRGLMLPDAHLLSGGGSSLFLTADGEAVYHARGLRVNRWRADPRLRGDGFFTHLREVRSGRTLSLTGEGRVRFLPGAALYHATTLALDIKTAYCLSPEDGALLRRVTISNLTRAEQPVELRDMAAICLCADAEAEEHPAFYDLFLECSLPDERALVLSRRSRERGRETPSLAYRVCGTREEESVAFCADRYGMLGRSIDPTDAAAAMAAPFIGAIPGAGLSPLQGSRIRLRLLPGETRTIGFSTLVTVGEEGESGARYSGTEAFLRAERLADAQSRAMLAFLELREGAWALYERASAMCVYAWNPLKAKSFPAEPTTGARQEALWPLGLSGDLPILLNVARSRREISGEMVSAHAYLRAMGVYADAVFVCDEEPGYSQPTRDAANTAIDESHLREMRGAPGGAFVYGRRELSPFAFEALARVASVRFSGGETLENALSSDPAALPQPFARIDPRPLPALERLAYNGWGGFSQNGERYIADILPGRSLPTAWSNILAGPGVGALITERGGGFLWYRNSRNARLTPFRNDPREEGEPLALLLETEEGALVPLLPKNPVSAFRVTVEPGETNFETAYAGLRARVTRFTDGERGEQRARIELVNESGKARRPRLIAKADWLMGVKQNDLRALRTGFAEPGLQWAAGAMPEIGFLCLAGSKPCGSGLAARIDMRPGETAVRWASVGVCQSIEEARAYASRADGEALLQKERERISELLSRVRFSCGEPIASAMVSRWLPYQALAARFLGRAGLYQSGGAYGFRDQLQDALCLIPVEPKIARAHLITCAAHQFEDGDAQHWWHPERTGVRTRISDDYLFLPYAAAVYVEETGDREILRERAPYLRNVSIPEGARDLYCEAEIADVDDTLDGHCLRALRRAASLRGERGLPLMGGGDWNDGMDEIGSGGKGESVWLGEFLIVAAESYARVCGGDAERAELNALAADIRSAIERCAWDGKWYLRAFRDDGSVVGGRESAGGCRIDALSQSWAALAGLDGERVNSAMEALWAKLYDGELGILRLLDPPFDGSGAKTGYIEGYPPGIRENGGQYTHAACWALLALCKLGWAERAWKLFSSLLPAAHSDTPEKAARYRVEPYALAADIYSFGESYAGRGGWTWYTGAAGWLFRAALGGLAGYSRKGDRAKVCALLRDGADEVRVTVRFGQSEYALISRRLKKAASAVLLDGKPQDGEYIRLIDDGKRHEALFPARNTDIEPL